MFEQQNALDVKERILFNAKILDVQTEIDYNQLKNLTQLLIFNAPHKLNKAFSSVILIPTYPLVH